MWRKGEAFVVLASSVPNSFVAALDVVRPVALSTATSVQSSCIPTILPTAMPTNLPTTMPTMLPTSIPTLLPTSVPTVLVTNIPSTLPTSTPTGFPTQLAHLNNTYHPSARPSSQPITSQPSVSPVALPSLSSTNYPTSLPTANISVSSNSSAMTWRNTIKVYGATSDEFQQPTVTRSFKIAVSQGVPSSRWSDVRIDSLLEPNGTVHRLLVANISLQLGVNFTVIIPMTRLNTHCSSSSASLRSCVDSLQRSLGDFVTSGNLSSAFVAAAIAANVSFAEALGVDALSLSMGRAYVSSVALSSSPTAQPTVHSEPHVRVRIIPLYYILMAVGGFLVLCALAYRCFFRHSSNKRKIHIMVTEEADFDDL